MNGNLTFASSAVTDVTGSCTIKLQFGSNAPPNTWAKVNVAVDTTGSPSCQLIADSVVLDQAGGPQPQLGPVVYKGQQNVSVVVTGAQPLTTIVAHCSGAWSDDLSDLSAIMPVAGGIISASQIIGTPFMENQVVSVGNGATVNTAVFPMLGYTGVLMQFIASGVSTMPTVTLQWLDLAVPPNQLYQANWQAGKIIDWVQAWGQQLRVQIQNNDTSQLSLTLMLVPLMTPPGRKADILTYKQTALNEIVSIRGTPVAGSGGNTTATSPANLGYSGPATVFLDTGWSGGGGDPLFAASISYGPTGTGKTMMNVPAYCPNMLGIPVDLPDQPITLSFTNNTGFTVTPTFVVIAGYR